MFRKLLSFFVLFLGMTTLVVAHKDYMKYVPGASYRKWFWNEREHAYNVVFYTFDGNIIPVDANQLQKKPMTLHYQDYKVYITTTKILFFDNNGKRLLVSPLDNDRIDNRPYA